MGTSTFKVHGKMCLELKKFVDKISEIYADIEAARPRCRAGLTALCELLVAMDKAKLLIQNCSESSKLYLAFTADRQLLKCQNIQNDLKLWLGQIQNMVPTVLEAKISGIVEDLRNAVFQLEFCEQDAGKLILGLLKLDIPPSISENDSELLALRVASRKLRISSHVDILVEKRCIKRVLNKLYDPNTKKAKILKYLLNLLRKYGDQILTEDDEYNFQPNPILHGSDAPEPPQEFKCPLSNRVMYDPVVIASGKTYERYWIEKWLNEGKSTCPMTDMKLDNLLLTPNGTMKRLISKWCSEHGINSCDPRSQAVPAVASSQGLQHSRSICSLASSLRSLRLQTSGFSFLSSNTASSCVQEEDNEEGFAVGLTSLSHLSSLPWESQCKALEYVNEALKKSEESFDWIFPRSHLRSVLKFLKDAYEFGDVKAQKDSAELILAILSKNRIEMPTLDADSIYMLTSFIDSEIRGEALALIELLSRQEDYISVIVASGVLNAILKVLVAQLEEFQELCMKILSNLSANDDLAYHILFLDCISKLVPFLGDNNLADYCLDIVSNLCNVEEGRAAVVETDGCISAIVKLLKTGTKLEQEKVVEILLFLCSEHSRCCQVAMEESNMHILFNMSVDGNSRAKVVSSELFQFLVRTKISDKSSSYVSSSLSKSSTDSKRGKSPAKAIVYMKRKFARLFGHSH